LGISIVGIRAYDKLQGIIMKKSFLNGESLHAESMASKNDLLFMAWNILQIL
jgi:hypothetical protein